MNLKKHIKVIAVCIFCIAMAGLEGAVVVYLRALFYPDGFSVLLKIMDKNILLIEIFRELCTIIMLWAVAYLVGKGFRERLAYFFLCFGIWDIFYYVWLKVYIDWPSSFLEWDILFLIPVTWLGPVLAPLICSVTMILFSISILQSSDKKFSSLTITLLIAGSIFILYTFMKDYGALMFEYGFVLDQSFFEAAKMKIPQPFSWVVFSLGELMLLGATVIYRFREN